MPRSQQSLQFGKRFKHVPSALAASFLAFVGLLDLAESTRVGALVSRSLQVRAFLVVFRHCVSRFLIPTTLLDENVPRCRPLSAAMAINSTSLLGDRPFSLFALSVCPEVRKPRCAYQYLPQLNLLTLQKHHAISTFCPEQQLVHWRASFDSPSVTPCIKPTASDLI